MRGQVFSESRQALVGYQGYALSCNYAPVCSLAVVQAVKQDEGRPILGCIIFAAIHFA